jgi:hypothetical protein
MRFLSRPKKPCLVVRSGYLKWLAKNNSSAFAALLGRVLPTVRHEVDLSIYSDADLETMICILGERVAARSMKGPVRAKTGLSPRARERIKSTLTTPSRLSCE